MAGAGGAVLRFWTTPVEESAVPFPRSPLLAFFCKRATLSSSLGRLVPHLLAIDSAKNKKKKRD